MSKRIDRIYLVYKFLFGIFFVQVVQMRELGLKSVKS